MLLYNYFIKKEKIDFELPILRLKRDLEKDKCRNGHMIPQAKLYYENDGQWAIKSVPTKQTSDKKKNINIRTIYLYLEQINPRFLKAIGYNCDIRDLFFVGNIPTIQVIIVIL